jgi:hypothetical protein
MKRVGFTLAVLILALPAVAQARPAAVARGGLDWSGQHWHIANGTFASGQKNLASNVQVSGGHVFIHIHNLTGGGIGSSTNKVSGTWTVTFRMSKGAGKYAIGLWPEHGSRPEVDFAEDHRGDPNRTEMTGTYHPGPGCNSCIHSKIAGDFTQWHTAAVVRTSGGFALKLDGKQWAYYKSGFHGAMHVFIHAEAWGDSGSSTLEVASATA